MLQETKREDFERVRAVLKYAVTGFVPQCEVEDLLWKRALEISETANEEDGKKNPPDVLPQRKETDQAGI